MKNIQEKVKFFCSNNQLNTAVEYRILDTISELGELSKEILKISEYGKNSIVLNDKIKLEVGDVFFSLITVANSLGIDLEKALSQVIEKYQRRITKSLSPDSKND